LRSSSVHATSDRTSDETAKTAVPAGATKTTEPERTFESEESIEIDADVHRVFTHWRRIEGFPRMLESVRRTKRIDERRALWDVDILGHQVVWESTVERIVPQQLIRWRSTWGARNTGEVRFEPLPGARTRLTVQIAYRPKGLLERLGAHLRLVGFHLRRDLARFKAFVERLPAEEPVEWPRPVASSHRSTLRLP
jgi:uncharacterized membrane protein